jgi:hypothetical protein
VATFFAYLDPASGSLIVQIVLGGLAAAAVTVKLWWHRVLQFLRLRPREPQETEPRTTGGD